MLCLKHQRSVTFKFSHPFWDYLPVPGFEAMSYVFLGKRLTHYVTVKDSNWFATDNKTRHT